MDLLRVVTHELGHVLGYQHLDASEHPDAMMSGHLTPGVRRLDTAHDSHRRGTNDADGSDVERIDSLFRMPNLFDDLLE